METAPLPAELNHVHDLYCFKVQDKFFGNFSPVICLLDFAICLLIGQASLEGIYFHPKYDIIPVEIENLPRGPEARWMRIISEARKMRRAYKTKESLKIARAALEAETQEVVRASKNLNENLGKAVKSIWRQLLFLWAIVAVLAVSYLWVLKNTPKTINLADAPQAHIVQGKLLPPVLPAPQAPDLSSIPAGEDLCNLLDQIREAQLKKDIQLFLNAYSPNLVNLKQKRDLTLNIWRRYDYIDLQYQLSNVIQEDASTILAQVTWNIKARDHKTDDVKILTKTYKVHFSKESSGNWLVQKLESVDGSELET